MKLLMLVFLLCCEVIAEGQTFVNLRVDGLGTNKIGIASNVLASVVDLQSPNQVSLYCQNSNAPLIFLGSNPGIISTKRAVLGPCELHLATSETNAFALLLLELREVNVLPVSPPPASAVFTVETSTNLATWQTITNAAFPASEPQRYFRSKLTLP